MKNYFFAMGLLLLGLAIIFCDFTTKFYAYYTLPLIDYSDPIYPYGGIEVFRNFIGVECSLGLVMNKGAAWGFFSDFQIPLVIARIVVIITMLTYLIFINQNKWLKIPLIFVIAGAMGNVADFFLYGFVIDFIHFKFLGYDFPVFNIADSSITIGITTLFFILFFVKNKSKQPIKIK